MSDKSKQFALEVYNASKTLDINPVFDTAQACLETGWGKSRIGKYNLFGVKADSSWKGIRVLVRTTEILKNKPSLQPGEKIISVTPLKTGNMKYICLLWFRDYNSLSEALEDHLKVLKNFPVAWAHRMDKDSFPYLIQREPYKDSAGNIHYKSYATDPNYAKTIMLMYKTLLKLGIK